MERRAFIKSSALMGAGVLLSDPWNDLLAQDVRGARPEWYCQNNIGADPRRCCRQDQCLLRSSCTARQRPARRGSWRRASRSHGPASANASNTVPRSPQGPSGLISEVAAEDRREAASEDCLRLNVWTPALGSGTPARDGLAARRRVFAGLGQLHHLRRRESRAAARRRGRHAQSSAQRVRVPVSRRDWRREVRGLG